jgi:glutathione synthase/RimK-type ligase-like ATP-grasp enzyme
MKHIPTFENFNNNELSYVNRSFMSGNKKPVLFLNWSYDIEDAEGNSYNIGKLIEKQVGSAEFSELDNIHFFDGCILNNTTKLENYSLVFIGLVTSYGADTDAYENFTLVQNYCKEKNIPVLCYGQPRYINNKYKQLQVLASNGLKIPKTYTCSGTSCDIDFVAENYKFPLVLKPAHGSQGRGVEIIKSKTELKKVAKDSKEEILLIQEFIPNDCDYRVFFIGDKHVFTVKRSRQDKKEFRNNVSLGAEPEFVELMPEQSLLARNAHQSMGLYVSGVDLVQNKETGEWFVLEINQAPQFSIFGSKKKIDSIINIFANNINNLRI